MGEREGRSRPVADADLVDAGAIFGTPFGQLPGQGFEGYVTISTTEDLDISAIYTSGSMKNGTASVQVRSLKCFSTRFSVRRAAV